LVQKWDGASWNIVEQNRYTYSFATDENATFTYMWTAVPGRYRFVIVADPDNTISEESETDNNAWIELNVPTWAVIYGEVNGIDVLGAGTYYLYTWSGTGSGVVLFYDADVSDLNVGALNPMTTTAELNRADYALGTNGNPDCILCRYDADHDGSIDSWHVFSIEGRDVNAPAFDVEGWPVGILWEGSGGSSFTGAEPIVFITEVYDDQLCSYSASGVCDYAVEIPSPLKNQFGALEEVRIHPVR
ncbi:TPA: hypothetical protein EYP13_03675, partial [Candidatus Micrarchaeota archaeon]|nr:hypothetical protein [Candidatus Micrarchaeota archaeon]